MVSTTRVLSLMAATAVQSVALSGRGLSSECAADAVALGTAGDFAIIAKSGISGIPETAITGDIGVSPIAATAITGFGLTIDSTNTFSTSPQITGQAFAADYAEPTPTKMIAAVGDMEIAYRDAESRASANSPNVGGGDLSSLTLTPGVYKFTVSINIAGAKTLTLAGDECSVFIFQVMHPSPFPFLSFFFKPHTLLPPSPPSLSRYLQRICTHPLVSTLLRSFAPRSPSPFTISHLPFSIAQTSENFQVGSDAKIVLTGGVLAEVIDTHTCTHTPSPVLSLSHTHSHTPKFSTHTAHAYIYTRAHIECIHIHARTRRTFSGKWLVRHQSAPLLTSRASFSARPPLTSSPRAA
jgi:hypothetical protein